MGFLIELAIGVLLDGALFGLADLGLERARRRAARMNVLAFAVLAGGLVAVAALTFLVSLKTLVLISLLSIPVAVVLIDLRAKWPPDDRRG